MIQLRKMREFTPKGQIHSKKYDSPLEPDITFTSIEDLLAKLDATIKEIPEQERYNLFCTLHNQPDDSDARKKKVWGKQDLILFDIDGVDLSKDHDLYLQVIATSLGVDPNSILQIVSGGGFHFIVKLKDPIKEVSFFETNKLYYQVLCSRINDSLRAKDLLGVADSAVFAPNRLFRVPLTLNIKPGREKLWVKLIEPHIDAIDLDLRKASGLPELKDTDFMTDRELSYIKVDSGTVESECEFLKYAKENQHDLNEPTWYAMLSIVARLDKGMDKIHEYSRFSPSYDAQQTGTKAEQSMKASGPRTCENIQSLWGGCTGCKHYKKCKSPINLKGENFIATSHSGFHIITQKGRLVPQYDDLKKFYNKETPYINVAKVHHKFDSTHWGSFSDEWIDSYAQENFKPHCDNKMAVEFRGLVKRSNLKPAEFFGDTTNRLINLKNGVLNIDTLKLEPHSPNFGFKHCLDFDYDPEAKAPLYQKHLDDISCGDKSIQMILLEFLGYAISGDPAKAQKYLILTGEGRNGKSTWLNISRKLCGSGTRSLKPSQLSKPFFRAKLDGALLNIMEEMPAFTNKEFWEDIKDLTTNGTAMGDIKHGAIFDFVCKTKFIMTCNELSKGATPSDGHFRRLLIVPFKAVFKGKKDDKFIADKIIDQEMPGVLNMVLEAYKRLVDNSYTFTSSKALDATLAEHKLDIDTVAQWIEEHVKIGTPKVDGAEPEWIKKDGEGNPVALGVEMYTAYRLWCDTMGNKPVNNRSFSKRLSLSLVQQGFGTHGTAPVSDRVRIDGTRQHVWRGVSYWDGAAL